MARALTVSNKVGKVSDRVNKLSAGLQTMAYKALHKLGKYLSLAHNETHAGIFSHMYCPNVVRAA